jgi:hypothetical protein
MSETMSVGVVGPSHWAYTATVMAECLGEFIKEKRVFANEIPKGVFLDAKDFFKLVLQAIRGSIPDNPPASINAYAIATDVVCNVSSVPSDQKQLDDLLSGYANLVVGLASEHELNDEELKKIVSLKEFFDRLARDGENEMYEQAIHFEPNSTVGFRVF